MLNNNTKNINIEVEHSLWKKLKIMSISKDMTLQDVVRDLLEQAVNKKYKQEVTEEV